jgi:hypothetical protein
MMFSKCMLSVSSLLCIYDYRGACQLFANQLYIQGLIIGIYTSKLAGGIGKENLIVM